MAVRRQIIATSPLPAPNADFSQATLTQWMTQGGDERIVLDPDNGLNRYKTAPKPQICAAYSSSTANFISAPAMAELERRVRTLPPRSEFCQSTYAFGLEQLRERLRATWRLPDSIDIVFAASGTDLEYVGLATAVRGSSTGIVNILLGAGEVGSGCPQAASGKHFAHQTPLGRQVEPGALIAGALAQSVRLVDIPMRAGDGTPVSSDDLMLRISEKCTAAIQEGRRALVHAVHGSKTGIIAPSLAHIDLLSQKFGDHISFVIDACQARISREAIMAYLVRGCTVFLTGSKFMGGPPFSGFALIPSSVAEKSGGLLPGFEKIFARAEWSEKWLGRVNLPERANFGLLMRLEASVFELERYNQLSSTEIAHTIQLFETAADDLAIRIGAKRLDPQSATASDDKGALPLEMRTLITLDLSASDSEFDFDHARNIYEALSGTEQAPGVTNLYPVRVGQPTRSVRFSDGRYRANLRLSLSMPQLVRFSEMSNESARQKLNEDFMFISRNILSIYEQKNNFLIK